jgi:hypothetical protein
MKQDALAAEAKELALLEKEQQEFEKAQMRGE